MCRSLTWNTPSKQPGGSVAYHDGHMAHIKCKWQSALEKANTDAERAALYTSKHEAAQQEHYNGLAQSSLVASTSNRQSALLRVGSVPLAAAGIPVEETYAGTAMKDLILALARQHPQWFKTDARRYVGSKNPRLVFY